MASEAIKVLVGKLFDIAVEEGKLVWGFKQDLDDLIDSLKSIQAVLDDALKRQVTDESVQGWLNKLEDVAYDADNLLDEIKYENLRRTVQEIQQTQCLSMISFFSKFPFEWKMAHKIQTINVKLNSINDEANRRRFERRLTESAFSMPEVKETDSYNADPVFVGRETDVSNLVKQITSLLDEVISVFPIVGMGGLGKTTLARNIFNHQSIKSCFDKKIWICVSDKFEVIALFKKILECLGDDDKFAGKSREEVVEGLHKKLGRKRYLLVLDDLWNKEGADWDDFKNTLLGVNPKKGNAIIVTAPGTEVASIVNPHQKYVLQQLTDDECWSIIRAKTFADKAVPLQFMTVGKEIASQCRGVPLPAKMIGGVLAGKEIQDWISIQKIGPSRLERDGETSVMKVLKISFDRLPSSSFKACFAYCSIFPKDTEINRKMLIQLWMAEGLLPDIQGYDMETTGNGIFKILFQNSFFQEPRHDGDGNIEDCKMHDLVHDLACDVSKSKSHIADHNGYVIPKVRYLTNLDEVTPQIAKENASYLRTLISLGSMPCKNLRDLENLRALLFSNGEDDGPISIAKLIHLRCLFLYCKAIPTTRYSICKLYNLQTLSISGPLKEISMLGHLPLLKNLQLSFLSEVTSIKQSFYGESCSSSTSSNVARVSFPSLKSLEMEDMENLTEWTEPQMSGVKVFPCLEHLLLSRCKNLTTLPSLRDSKASFKTLKIQDCYALKELAVDLYEFQSLETLKIDSCSNLQLCIHPKAQKGHFSLRRLEISGSASVRVSEILAGCTSLQHLELDGCDTHASLPELSGMGSVQHLRVSNCHHLTSLPELSEMVSLQHLHVSDCFSLISLSELSGMIFSQHLHVSDCFSLISLPELSAMISVQRLHVSNCESLTSFPELSGIESLQFLKVYGCSLFPTFSGTGCFNSLRELRIGNSWSRYGGTVDGGVNTRSSFYDFFDGIQRIKSLEKLKIVGEKSWISLPAQIQHLTSLKR